MKRLIITFLIVVGATHSIVWAQQGSRLERIIKSGELRVGTSGRQPPMTARSKDGELMGYEIELAVMLAEVMNLRVRFVQMAFSDLLPSLEEGTVDVVMSGMTI
ncbi:MAG: transporter substrate-binding domain-containing protein, partial [Ignavibacteria bacterium]|nr:transporter substrate-binding domain-containing protein [Ignavibacteria bacterium]